MKGKAVPVPLPSWCNPKIAEIEELIEVKQRDASSSWAGYIRYTDAQGEMSERRIVCRSIEGYGKAETVNAWCCERKASRSFRIDRMAELVCLETGEVLDPIQHFEQLRLHGALKVKDKSLNDFGRILVFMARCDGEVHPLEAESVDEALERYILRFGGDDRMLASAQANIGKIAPDGDDFVASLDRIQHHPEARSLSRLLLDCVSNVASADGELHPSEVEWAGLVSDTLKVMAR
ncbi:TerB family tellurite resistance protein [Novosphingobium sp. UBA1939]|uniref:tellurite resistance TerB family protein n=1 Tax=Novosphingobium sp. UBA1939 TaxID=1946982 RepID=UPI0025F05B2E|nr:TerB family tellurite resistance protein [Novosphingobium sp. UBA1939]